MNVKSVYEIKFTSYGDERGFLTSIEGNRDIPFDIKRIFYMHNITKDRGGHAHIDTDQVIIAISGSFNVRVFDGMNEDIYFLADCTKGVFTPRLTFCELFNFSLDAVCLVIANTHYDFTKSLRNRDDYLKFIGKIYAEHH